ncbi:MAG: alpha/beta fold hydrolase [Candidatus Cyclobacteriaceae bacterium M2_1C_046]
MAVKALHKIIFYTIICACGMSSMETIAQEKFDALQYPYEMKLRQLDGDLQIAYADEGEGEVILFIHGMGSYAPAWYKNVNEIKKSYRCIVVDLIGYGKSSKGKFAADMSFHANSLFELMDALEVDQFNIAGHSMGGQIAIHMALKQPEKITSLMLMAPAGIETFTEEEKSVFFAMTPEQVAGVSDEQYRNNLALNFFKMPEDAEFMYDDRMIIKEDIRFLDYCHVVVEGVRGMLNEPVFERLSEINLPVMVLYGKEDLLIPNRYMHPALTTVDVAELAQKQFPSATVKLIDEAGHFVHFEQPEIANTLIKQFLNRTNQN